METIGNLSHLKIHGTFLHDIKTIKSINVPMISAFSINPSFVRGVCDISPPHPSLFPLVRLLQLLECLDQ